MSVLELNPDFDIASFLAEHWQQKPVLLRQLVQFEDPLSADELGGLACESEIESRLVTGSRYWELQQGPFQESELTRLPLDSWTLLVQGVDLFFPEFRTLRDLFQFLPKWRFEDVMASFATPGGGVGPHFDYYDVFLVQGSGQRRWRLGKICAADDETLTESGLQLLANFESEEEFILDPGDVLYVPPQYSHWGEAISNSFCYSVGFRAPSAADMLEGFSDALIQRAEASNRFTNKQQSPVHKSHEIGVQDVNTAFSLIRSELSDENSFAKWFGAFMTRPKYPELFIHQEKNLSVAELRKLLSAQDASLTLNPASRLAYMQNIEQGQLCFFVDGRVYSLASANIEIISQLCEATHLFNEVFFSESSSEELLNVVLDMVLEGSLLLGSETETD